MALWRICCLGLAFLRRRAILILWMCYISTVFWNSYSKYKKEPKYFYLRQILGSGLCLSRGMAAVLNVSCFMAVLPMCRFLMSFFRTIGSKISVKCISLWSDASKSFHIMCSTTILIAGVFHSVAHMVNTFHFSYYYNSNYEGINMAKFKGEDPLIMTVTSVPGITGVLMMIILCILSSSSIKYIRTISYDIFWLSHHLFLAFLLLLLCHPLSGVLKEQSNVHVHFPGCKFIKSNNSFNRQYDSFFKSCSVNPTFVPQKTETWKWVTAAVLLYLVDLLCRLFRRRRYVHILSVQACKCYLLSLKFLKNEFVARPGQFIYLHCPNVSTVEWHPFTISKCPTDKDPSFTIHLRTNGDWSGSIHQSLCAEISVKSGKNIDFKEFHFESPSINFLQTKFLIDGPFGSCMENVLHFSVSICIAGGIGFTPFASILSFLRSP